MKQTIFRRMLGAVIVLLLTVPAFAQTPSGGEKKPASPPAQAKVELAGNTVTIDYSAPSMRGRKVVGGLVPYDKVWRTGANAATTLKTPVALRIGNLAVPAGTYTLYTLPSESGWKLIVNKQTGQWGTEYNQDQDLGRVPMTVGSTSSPVETFVIHFEKTSKKQTQLHLTWDNTDVWVAVSAS
jgi:DUF2911 family protein